MTELPPYRAWYRFGRSGPSVLYRRLVNRRPRPILQLRVMWQRARRGWSDADVWSFDVYLSEVIAGGVARLRESTHSHPMGLDAEGWSTILSEIEQGMKAGREYLEFDWPEGGEAAFKLAMSHLSEYWFDLWD